MIINLTISWQLCIVILVIVFFFIWLIYGGGDHEYIGLAPLKIGYDASRNEEHLENSEEEIIDNTPPIPDLTTVDLENISTENFSCENIETKPKIKNHFYSSGSFESASEEFKENKNALGPYKCYNSGKKSKGELLCKQAIEEIYGKPFYCVRPNFLKNPETKRNLEIDLYNDELKIGVEYNSEQHYVFPNYFHKTHEEFINQVRRDQFKVEQCDANGVYLISVPYNVPLTLEDIKKYIILKLPENTKMIK